MAASVMVACVWSGVPTMTPSIWPAISSNMRR
jgi:hypothetical protein